MSAKKTSADARAEHGAMTEAEIDAALNDDELDQEFEHLRLARLQQLRSAPPYPTPMCCRMLTAVVRHSGFAASRARIILLTTARNCSPVLSGREGAPSKQKGMHDKKTDTAAAKRGALAAIPAESLLDLVQTGQPVVVLLTPGDKVPARASVWVGGCVRVCVWFPNSFWSALRVHILDS